jgi:hypothetical protein
MQSLRSRCSRGVRRATFSARFREVFEGEPEWHHYDDIYRTDQ